MPMLFRILALAAALAAGVSAPGPGSAQAPVSSPIVVNSLRVTDCVNLRSGSCGLHFPKVLIRPGEERRVYTIRFAGDNRRTSYRYNYQISEADDARRK